MKKGVNWHEIKARYEAGETAYSIAFDYPITKQGIAKRAKMEGWGKGNSDWLTVAEQIENVPTAPNAKSQPVLIAGILEAVSKGASETLAAQAAGIDSKTLSRWKSNSPQLSAAIRTARGQVAIERIDSIEQAHKRGDWKAAAYLLERDDTTRDDFGQTQGGAPTGNVFNLQINIG